MGRLELADYGFRSWMLQELDRPYEVILLLFNDQQARFEKLAEVPHPNCRLLIKSYERPAFFNISVIANNLGIHFARGRYILFANADVIYPGGTARTISDELTRRDICYAILSRASWRCRTKQSAQARGRHRVAGDFDPLSNLDTF